MTNKKDKRKTFLALLTEFAKLQLAGNIPFWGTYLGYTFLDKVGHVPELPALTFATVVANGLFFIIDDQWVFSTRRGRRGNKKTSIEAVKFIIFISFNATLNLFIVHGLSVFANISPYIGQFISATLSTVWVFTGLRFWVFAPPRHHGLLPPKRTARRGRHAA